MALYISQLVVFCLSDKSFHQGNIQDSRSVMSVQRKYDYVDSIEYLWIGV